MNVGTVYVKDNGAVAADLRVITSGMVGATVRFVFDSSWDGYNKTLVWKAGDVTKDDTTASGVIPHEVLAVPGDRLVVGVYGVKDGAVTPTLYAKLGPILSGADPSGDPSTDPTLPVWAQVQEDIERLEAAKDEAVQAASDAAAAAQGVEEHATAAGNAASAAQESRNQAVDAAGQAVGAANTATAQATAASNAAAAAEEAKAAAEAAAERAEATDVGDLAGRVDALNDVVFDTAIEIILPWEYGSITPTAGAIPEVTQQNRMRTTGYIPAFSSVVIAPGYKIAICGYAADGTYNGTLNSNGVYVVGSPFNWLTGTVEADFLNSEYQHKLVFARADDADLTEGESENIDVLGPRASLADQINAIDKRVAALEDGGPVDEITLPLEIGSFSKYGVITDEGVVKNRMRTVDFLPVFSSISVADGYKIAIPGWSGGVYQGTLNNEGEYTGAGVVGYTWHTGVVYYDQLNSNYQNKIIFARADDGNVAADEYVGNLVIFDALLPDKVNALDERVALLEGAGVDEPERSATECINAFVAEMNRKAQLLGMTTASFDNPSGIQPTNTATAKDMVRLGIACCGNDKLLQVWGKKAYTVTTKDAQRKAVALTSSVQDPALDNYYTLLGGKTGATGTGEYTLIAVCEVEGQLVVGAVGGATSKSGRFAAMKELMDIAAALITNTPIDATVTSARCACCALLPKHNANLYERYDFEWLYEQNADTVYSIASNTKCLAMLVMLDYCTDLHDTAEFISSDAIGGTGAVFTAGDVISYEDALYAAMLPSSNMATQLVARTLGEKMLNKYKL